MAIPWGLVNMKQSDHFHLLPNAGGVNLYLGNKRTADGMEPKQERRVAYVDGQRYEDSVELWAREEYESAARAHGREPDSDPMAISNYWTRRALDEINADPTGWLKLIAKKCWLTLWNVEVPNNKAFSFLQEEFIWLRILPVRWVVLLILAPAGIWAAANWGRRDALFILLVYAGLYSAANIAFFICDRYRYPVWPVMAVVAGGGLMASLEAVRLRRWGTTACLGASMVLLSALSLHNWFGAKLPSYARDYLFRSIARYGKGHFDAASDDINRSITLDPDDITALEQQGNILFALNRLDGARESFEQSLRRARERRTSGTTLESPSMPWGGPMPRSRHSTTRSNVNLPATMLSLGSLSFKFDPDDLTMHRRLWIKSRSSNNILARPHWPRARFWNDGAAMHSGRMH